jgi:hypothetical protein
MNVEIPLSDRDYVLFTYALNAYARTLQQQQKERPDVIADSLYSDPLDALVRIQTDLLEQRVHKGVTYNPFKLHAEDPYWLVKEGETENLNAATLQLSNTDANLVIEALQACQASIVKAQQSALSIIPTDLFTQTRRKVSFLQTRITSVLNNTPIEPDIRMRHT